MEDIIEIKMDDLLDLEINLAKKEYEELQTKVLAKLLDKKPRDATELIAKYIEDEKHIKTTQSDNGSELWYYQDGIYKPNGKSIIEKLSRQILKEGYTTYLKNEIIGKVIADTYIPNDEFFDQQNASPYIIPVENGVLNLKTRKLTGFTPKKYFFNKINAIYEPGQDCPFWIKFVNEVVDGQDIVDTIQEWFGYCLVKNYKFEKSIMFHGANGRNGKTKTIEVLQHLLGTSNYTNISLKTIENKNDRFSLGELRNKLLNVVADISPEALNNEGRFKGLTGGDHFTVDQKFKEHFTFKNYAKMMFSGNELPVPSDTSDAFWSRWILVEFPYRFLPQKERDVYTPAEQIEKGICLQNPDLLVDLTTSVELSGILNWSLKGLTRLEKTKDFSYQDTQNIVKKKWLLRSTNILAFIGEHLKEDYDSVIDKHLFKSAYVGWCKKNGVRPISDKRLFDVLTKDFAVQSSRAMLNGEQRRVWEGLKWISQAPGANKIITK